MSRERKFHELIEQQNREEKDAAWAKLQQKEAEREKKEFTPALPKTRSFFRRKWVQIVASSVVTVGIGVFAMWGFLSLKDGNNDNKGRYFSSQSFEKVEVQYTLKEYAQEIGENLLYFDWYEETDYLKNQAWQLKDTQEIICFQEDIIDVNTGCPIYIFVIETDTEIENFSFDVETNKKSEIKKALHLSATLFLLLVHLKIFFCRVEHFVKHCFLFAIRKLVKQMSLLECRESLFA